eukprot:1156383-Pelagomonas_calceolata.AAC.7
MDLFTMSKTRLAMKETVQSKCQHQDVDERMRIRDCEWQDAVRRAWRSHVLGWLWSTCSGIAKVTRAWMALVHMLRHCKGRNSKRPSVETVKRGRVTTGVSLQGCRCPYPCLKVLCSQVGIQIRKVTVTATQGDVQVGVVDVGIQIWKGTVAVIQGVVQIERVDKWAFRYGKSE